MNPETKKQTNESPDLSFILEEGSEKKGSAQKKPINKKILIIIILLFITPLVLIVTALVSSENNVQKENPQTNTESVTVEQVAIVFFNALGSTDYTSARAQLSEKQKNILSETSLFYLRFWMDTNSVSLQNCRLVQAGDSGESLGTVEYTCPDEQNQHEVTFGLTFIDEDNSKKIDSISIKGSRIAS